MVQRSLQPTRSPIRLVLAHQPPPGLGALIHAGTNVHALLERARHVTANIPGLAFAGVVNAAELQENLVVGRPVLDLCAGRARGGGRGGCRHGCCWRR
jgi:hypothetical protein